LTCPRCGQALSDEARVCSACGEPLGEPSTGPEPTPAPAATPATRRRSVVYAGFWLRAVAYVADSFLLGLVFTLVVLAPLMERGAIPKNNPEVLLTEVNRQFLAIQLLAVMMSWLYFASFESSSWQATPGKRLLGLVVTDVKGHRISFARASGRYFGKLLSEAIFFIGFFMAGITPHKQALHDMLASCLVLRRPKRS
jgi:uncharacterized RDD family membrane protein YckC